MYPPNLTILRSVRTRVDRGHKTFAPWGNVRSRDTLRGHVSAPAHSAGAATGVTGSEQGEEAEAGHEDGQQRETQPPLAQLPVSVITGTNVIICKQNKRTLIY